MTEQIIGLVLRSFSFFCSRFFVSTPSTISFTSWEIVQAKREASLQFRILTSHTNTLLPSLLISQIPRIPSLRICLQMMYNSLMRQYFSQNRTKPVKLHRKMLEDIQLQFTGGLPSLCGFHSEGRKKQHLVTAIKNDTSMDEKKLQVCKFGERQSHRICFSSKKENLEATKF